MYEYCEACETRVEPEWDHKEKADIFLTTDTGEGPYCSKCFYFIRHIEALRDRVTDIERKLRQRPL